MTRNKANGFAIGKKADGTPYSWPESRYGNLAVIGKPGSGKTRTILANKLLAALRAGESVLCFDPKQELQNLFADAFEKNGFDVRTDGNNTLFKSEKLYWPEIEEIGKRKIALFTSEASTNKVGPLMRSVDSVFIYTVFYPKDDENPIHFVLDEFSYFLGNSDLNDLVMEMELFKRWEVANIDFTISIQSEEQLKTTCGAKLCRKILYDLCDAQIFLGQGKHGEPLPNNKQELFWMPDSDDILLNLYDYRENPASVSL